ncbi:putative ABC transporter A, P-loop containing nucleoside triphosphate hydrolase [Helianthus anomalus]
MESQKGFKLLLQQYKALFTKNLLLAWRNKRATFLQLFSSVFFIFLLFIIQKAIEARFGSSTAFKTVRDPESLIDPPIPPCEDKFFAKLPCYDFVWSGNHSARFGSIVDRIKANNPGRPIPSDKVRSFRTKNDVDAWLLANPMTCPGALHFVDRNATVISYGLQTNSTPIAKRGDWEDPTFKFEIPLQIAAEREIARSLIGELKLRQVVAMTMMGLYDTAYWLSWLTWEGIITLLSSLFTIPFGMMFQFDFFLNNSFAVVFSVYFLFQLNMISFAFMFSSFITKSTSSTAVGFSIYIVGFLTQLLFDATSTPQDPGISWASRGKCAPNDTDCLITLNDIYIWLLATFILWVALAIYFDNIFPNSSGGRICSCMSSIPPSGQTSPDDEDVLEEENIVKQQHREGVVDPNLAVQIQGPVKVYPRTTNVGCFNCKKTAPYHALKFDILWDTLSGQEHLYLFASIKGLPPSSLKKVVQKSLAEVRLSESARVRTRSYIGGMKRHLSVAIALIGELKLVILDEPVNVVDFFCSSKLLIISNGDNKLDGSDMLGLNGLF